MLANGKESGVDYPKDGQTILVRGKVGDRKFERVRTNDAFETAPESQEYEVSCEIDSLPLEFPRNSEKQIRALRDKDELLVQGVFALGSYPRASLKGCSIVSVKKSSFYERLPNGMISSLVGWAFAIALGIGVIASFVKMFEEFVADESIGCFGKIVIVLILILIIAKMNEK